MCESFGVSLKEEKTTMANTQLVFLGIEIDTQAMEMRLPVVLWVWAGRNEGL